MSFGLPYDTFLKIQSVFRHFPEIEQVIIYGSRAKGDYREGSDIDLVLKGDNLTLEINSKIATQIDELNTPYLFDISIFDLIDSKNLVDHVNKIGKVFYNSQISPKLVIK